MNQGGGPASGRLRRTAILGEDAALREAVRALGFAPHEGEAEIAFIDADDDAAVSEAGVLLAADLPRVFVASPPRAALLRAAGIDNVVSRPFNATSLGPLVFALERARSHTPRVLLFASAVGATGRTSLVANLAVRLSARLPVIALDATGTGALSWRLGAAVAPWSDLASVGEELGEGHLRIAAGERDGALIVGGAGVVADAPLRRVVEVARSLGTVIVDAPPHWLVARLADIADRLYICANPDPASAAVTISVYDAELADGAQLIVSQAGERDARSLAVLFGRAPAFLIPRDEPACRASLARRGPADGALGRAYDAIAEIVLADLGA